MMHYFDIDIAKEYGIAESVLIQNIAYWVEQNRANGNNLHDGRYWTYNSRRALSILFPYWTENQVKTVINNLVKNGLILKGNYNNISYDRTNWYTLSDKGENLINRKSNHEANLTNASSSDLWLNKSNHEANLTNASSSDLWLNKSNPEANLTNGKDTFNQPIPDIKPYNKHNKNTPHVEVSKKVDIDLIVEEFNKLGAPFRKVQKLTPNRKKKAIERLREMGSTEEFISVIKSLPKYPFLRGEGSRGWVATFDFLIANPENWVKIKEGIYDNDKQQTSRSESYGQRNTHSKVQDEFGEEGAKAILRSTI